MWSVEMIRNHWYIDTYGNLKEDMSYSIINSVSAEALEPLETRASSENDQVRVHVSVNARDRPCKT